jgi:hypothetical protein
MIIYRFEARRGLSRLVEASTSHEGSTQVRIDSAGKDASFHLLPLAPAE